MVSGQDNAEAYVAILDKMNQKTSAARDEALNEAKNEYNAVANTHYNWLTSHGVLGDLKSRYGGHV